MYQKGLDIQKNNCSGKQNINILSRTPEKNLESKKGNSYITQLLTQNAAEEESILSCTHVTA